MDLKTALKMLWKNPIPANIQNKYIHIKFHISLYRLSSLDLLVVLTCAFWVRQGKLNKTSFCHYQLTITGPLVTITGDILTKPYGIQPTHTLGARHR